ncbi:MAG: hypothetical protein UHD04_08615 [Muribaculaceae bacterium]|jgi:hypothetical protein|nr:hypothetical protein [Muribaculaceae bacterium]
MSENKVFDENDAIKFIREYIPENIKNKYSDNDILLLMDTMYDFFDEEDDDDFDEENFDDEAYLNNIVNYVKKSIRKDPENAIEMDDVKHLVMGELEYEATLDDIF